MTNSKIIRKATLLDRHIIYRIHVDAVTTQCVHMYGKSLVEKWFIGRVPDDYTGAIEYGGVWLACSNGEPVGFTEVFPNVISMMYVRSAFVGRGFGRRLIEFALEQAIEDRGSVVEVEATLNAQPFYEHFGFRKIGQAYIERPSGLKIPTILMELRAPP